MSTAPTAAPIKARAGIKGGVSAAVRHDSALGHVTGRAVYLDDMPMAAGALEAALVLSPHAHARILSIDSRAALALPGVVAVVTAADIPGVNDIGPILKGEPALADGVAEYAGHPLAAVAPFLRRPFLRRNPDATRGSSARHPPAPGDTPSHRGQDKYAPGWRESLNLAGQSRQLGQRGLARAHAACAVYPDGRDIFVCMAPRNRPRAR